MKHLFNTALATAFAFSFAACNNNSAKTSEAGKSADTAKTVTVAVKEEPVDYSDGSVTMKGFVAYDSNSTAKRPVVLIIPEWWGIGDYVKNRAKQLAELGYIAMALDFYGNAAQGETPETAGKLAEPFYKDPQLAKKRFDAALAKIKTFAQADTSKIAAIGYCFGGAQVLNLARLGENLAGVVSFHGNLVGVTPDKNKVKAKILVCHGENDQFVPKEEVEKFKKQTDSAGVAYTFKSYSNATHAFTNPEATEKGKKFKLPIEYNEAADKASWTDMKVFFSEIFK
ncbi:dienelactone hydrolase family protein [Ferruginibacter sp. HRS2-29]|uniref:dienelactone hydrolase family protein n=1 Tax=Ferruginibacter sp. HRS2-29 TaxID=2487334 RepID=UPI0020CCFB5E|nr:dienelactone hydrolase family protein [Ferruginibacter sp. HRS2-29]MCP9753390.1 dienelactone hydrolase family protein [Ferruginibacter sp. HRS2-29]